MTTTTFTSGTVIESTWLNDVDNSIYQGKQDDGTRNAAVDLYLQSGTGATERTVQAKLRETISVKDFGAVGDGTTNDTSAVQAALTAGAGLTVYIPAGTYMVSGLTVPDNTVVYGDGVGSVLKKNANGDVITLGAKSTLSRFYIDGNGATYTGRGVVISTGAVDPAPMTTSVYWRRLIDVDIINTASYCVEFTAAIAGYGSQIRGGRLVPYNNYLTAAVKLPTASETNGNRSMIGVFTGSNVMCDLGGCNNMIIQGCQGGHPTFTSNTQKANITGNRFSDPGAALAFDGSQNVVVNNIIAASAITYNSGVIGGLYENYTIGTITDNSPSGASNATSIYIPQQIYTPTWAGSGGSPAIGNGTLAGAWSRRGFRVAVNILFTVGSTTAFNTTTQWTFTLPYASSRNATGSVYILDSGTQYYIGIARVASGSNLVSIYRDATLPVGYLTPMTWATGDSFNLDIEYSA